MNIGDSKRILDVQPVTAEPQDLDVAPADEREQEKADA